MAGDLIRPADLVTERTSPVTSEFMVVDNGVTVAKSKISDVVKAGFPLASQAEAEAGTNPSKAMTPLTTKQAVTARIGVDIASKAQGDKADTAVQPGDLASVATSGDYDDLSGKPTLGTAAAEDIGFFATAAQGALADTAVQPYPTAVGVAALTIPDGINFIRTNGYSAPGDGGGANYKRVDTEPSHPGKIQSADGAWWELARGQDFTVEMFGAVGDGSTNCLPSFNRCSKAVAALGGGIVKLLGATYLLVGISGAYDAQYFILQSNVHWEGTGATVLKRGSVFTLVNSRDSSDIVPGYAGKKNFSFRGITFDGNPAISSTAAANIMQVQGCQDFVIEECTFKDSPGLHCIDLISSKNWVISGNKFIGQDQALSVIFGGSSYYPEAIQISHEAYPAAPVDPDTNPAGGTVVAKNGIIENNYFGNSTTAGMSSFFCAAGNHGGHFNLYESDIKFINNVVDDSVYAAFRCYKFNDILIEGNTFNRCRNAVQIVIIGPDAGASDYDDGTPSGLPQAGSGITIANNTMIDGMQQQIYCLQPTFTGSNWAKTKDITIVGNKITASTATAFSAINLVWCTGVVCADNTLRKYSRGIYGRFIDLVSFVNNIISDNTTEGIQLNEVTETTFAGLGLTRAINIAGGVIERMPFYGINISGAIAGIKIAGVLMSEVSTLANTRGGITLAGVDNVDIDNLQVLDGPAAVKPLYAVQATSACSNVRIGRVSSFLTSLPVKNQATGNSRSNYEGSGTPEGVCYGTPGSTYADLANGKQWTKATGNGTNTGWVVVGTQT